MSMGSCPGRARRSTAGGASGTEGLCRKFVRLRRGELEDRFPGLLDLVLGD
jgi:hypothetical protein